MHDLLENKSKDDVINRFKEYLYFEELTVSTKRLYLKTIVSFLNTGEYNIDGVNKFIIQRGREKRSLYVRSAMIHFLRFINKKELIEKLVKLRKKGILKVHITRSKEEQQEIIDNIRSDTNRLIALIQFSTSLRAADVLRLTKDRIIKDSGDVYVKGKIKGEKEHVPLYIPYPVKKLLLEYVEKRKYKYLFLETDDQNLREMHRIYQRYRRDVMRAAKSIGIDKFTTHEFRHNFLSELYNSTHDPYLVKEVAGHVSFDTTMGYIHQPKEDIKKGIKKIRE